MTSTYPYDIRTRTKIQDSTPPDETNFHADFSTMRRVQTPSDVSTHGKISTRSRIYVSMERSRRDLPSAAISVVCAALGVEKTGSEIRPRGCSYSYNIILRVLLCGVHGIMYQYESVQRRRPPTEFTCAGLAWLGMRALPSPFAVVAAAAAAASMAVCFPLILDYDAHTAFPPATTFRFSCVLSFCHCCDRRTK